MKANKKTTIAPTRLRERIWSSSVREHQARPLTVLTAYGSHAQIGRQVGEGFRASGGWQPVLDYYTRMASIALAGPSQTGRRLVQPLAQAGMKALDKRLSPEVQTRHQAFAEALGVDAKATRALQVFDTMQNIAGLAGNIPGTPLVDQRAAHLPSMCSSLSAWDIATTNGQLLHGRNFDLPGVGVFDQSPTIIFCTPESGLRYGYATACGGDAWHISSFNEAGLCITTHNRFHKSTSFRGTPLLELTHKLMTQAQDLHQAIDIIKQMTPIASSYGILISSRRDKSAVAVETCGKQIAVVRPDAASSFLPATNHYIDSQIAKDALSPNPAFLYSSRSRYGHLQNVGKSGNIDATRMCQELGSFTTARGDERATGGVVAQVHGVQSIVIAPDEEAVYLSVGNFPSSGGPWQRVPWKWQNSASSQMVPAPSPSSAAFEETREARAYRHLVDASRHPWTLDGMSDATMAEHLENASTLVPEDPSYRVLAAGAALRLGKMEQALDHLRSAEASEPDPFYRAQLDQWQARVLQASGCSAEAKRYWNDFGNSPHFNELSKGKTKMRKWSKARLKKTALTFHVAGLTA